MKNNLSGNSSDGFTRESVPQKARNAVCLCTDRRMMIPALFVADAVQSYSRSSGNVFDILIFSQPSEVTDVQRQWMAQRGIICCDDMDIEHMRGVGKFQERLSPATLMKLLLAGHLAGRYDKILYLDCDLTIHDDLAAIFSLDPSPFVLAAVPSGRVLLERSEKEREDFNDHCRKLGMSKPYRFFNTGVLYIDVKKWNDENIGLRALDYIRKNPDLCSLPDEHALNAVLDGSIAELSPVWNSTPPPRWRNTKQRNLHPVIVHHTGDDKPWRRFVYNKGLLPDLSAYRLYEDFLKDSPWPDWLGEQWTGRDLYLNMRWEIGRFLRKLGLRGGRKGLGEPSKLQILQHMNAVRKYLKEERFVDVEQGIVIRKNGKLHLDKKQ